MNTFPQQVNVEQQLTNMFTNIYHTFDEPHKALDMLAKSPVNPFMIAKVLEEQQFFSMETAYLDQLIQACECGLELETNPSPIHAYNFDQLCMGYIQGVGDVLLQNFKIDQRDNTLCELRKALISGAKVEDLNKGFSTKQLKIINKCIRTNMDISVLSKDMTVKEMDAYLKTGELKKVSKTEAVNSNRQKLYDQLKQVWVPAFGDFTSDIFANLTNMEVKDIIYTLKFSYIVGKLKKEVTFKPNMTYDEIMKNI